MTGDFIEPLQGRHGLADAIFARFVRRDASNFEGGFMLDPKEILTALSDRFSTTGRVQTVFGEPIQAHGRTILPVASVKYGLGAGGGGENKSQSDDAVGGSGGGGGVKVTPIGVLEITEAGTKFIRFFDPKATARLIGAGILIGFLLRRALRWRR
jgi:uncharacterized spore protein YtfJ